MYNREKLIDDEIENVKAGSHLIEEEKEITS